MRKLVEIRYPKAEKLLKELLTKGGADAGYFEGNIAPENDGESMATIAMWNEFGSERYIQRGDDFDQVIRTPWRPFMALAAEDSEPEMIKLVQYEMSKVNYKSVLCYKKLGLLLAKNIKKRIQSSPSWAIPNSKFTIMRKGSSHPLVDNGYLLKSVDFKYTVG